MRLLPPLGGDVAMSYRSAMRLPTIIAMAALASSSCAFRHTARAIERPQWRESRHSPVLPVQQAVGAFARPFRVLLTPGKAPLEPVEGEPLVRYLAMTAA